MGKILELKRPDFRRVSGLFDAYDYDRSLIGSVLEGRQDGRVFYNGEAAVLFHPGDYAYLAGDPEQVDVRALLETVPVEAGVETSEFEVFCPRNTTWIAHLLDAFGDRAIRSGYEYFTFTEKRLDWVRDWETRVPDGMQVVLMDEGLAKRSDAKLRVATAETWGSAERFVAGGFGFVVTDRAGELAGAISTFAIGEGEAEIDIATHRAYRRKGLATLMGCAFVCHCLAQGLTPSWTANFGNAGSTATARRLGFVDRFILPCFTLKGDN